MVISQERKELFKRENKQLLKQIDILYNVLIKKAKNGDAHYPYYTEKCRTMKNYFQEVARMEALIQGKYIP